MTDEDQEPTGADVEPLFSELLAECPELQTVVDEFASTLPDRLGAMEASLRAGSMDRLAKFAHQLKGAGGSHGYRILTDQAAAIERAAHDHALDQLSHKLEELSELICRIRAGLERDES